jgi:hypothetical protein
VKNIFVGICAVIGYVVIIAVIMALPIWILWNWLMPVIFNLPTINIFQALGLSLLSGCLFGSRSKKSEKNSNTNTL